MNLEQTRAKEARLTAADLRSIVSYCPVTGSMRWAKRIGQRTPIGGIVGRVTCFGYLSVKINRREYFVHRLVWLYVTGTWPVAHIDHINCVKDDNRFSNLRQGDDAFNSGNRRAPNKNNRSGFLGVAIVGARFLASIGKGRKHLRLGEFDTPEEAHAAYLHAKRQLHTGNCL